MKMNYVLGHDSALVRYTGPGTTWANEMKCFMNHTPGARSSLDLLASSPALPLYHGYMDIIDKARVKVLHTNSSLILSDSVNNGPL